MTDRNDFYQPDETDLDPAAQADDGEDPPDDFYDDTDSHPIDALDAPK